MVRIVREVEAIMQNPLINVDLTRPNAYIRPEVFQKLLPIVRPVPVPVGKDTYSQSFTFGSLNTTANLPIISQDLTMDFPAPKLSHNVAVGFSLIDIEVPQGKEAFNLRCKTYAHPLGLTGPTNNTNLSRARRCG